MTEAGEPTIEPSGADELSLEAAVAPPPAEEPLPTSASPEPAPALLAGPVGAREILWRSLDLNLAAAPDVRRVAILIGLLGLAAGGPLVADLVALGNRIEQIDRATFSARRDLIEAALGARNLVLVAMIVGALSLIALTIDSQLLAVDVIARRATRRTFALRHSLELVRMRFWRLLRANVLIAVILVVPRWVVSQSVAPGGVVRESQVVAVTILGILLSIPFAYVAVWILLGQVGARESVRRSWRLARRRPSLAIVIAVLNTLFQTIALFALGAAADPLARVVDALGLGNATGLGLAPLAGIVALGIVAAGSLVMTIAALTAGPAVVAFLRLTGDASGLDALRDPDNPFATPRVEPLVSRPMKIALLIEAVIAVLALTQLL